MIIFWFPGIRAEGLTIARATLSRSGILCTVNELQASLGVAEKKTMNRTTRSSSDGYKRSIVTTSTSYVRDWIYIGRINKGVILSEASRVGRGTLGESIPAVKRVPVSRWSKVSYRRSRTPDSTAIETSENHPCLTEKSLTINLYAAYSVTHQIASLLRKLFTLQL